MFGPFMSSLVRFLVLSCLLAVLFGSAGAGTGKFDAATGELEFCVSIRFSATATQIDNIKTAFTNASQVLADATDGQCKFGKVHIVNNSGSGPESEVWIMAGSSGAYATNDQYGVRGQHIVLYYTRHITATDADYGAYTIAHEFCHHVWGLGDEYIGPEGGAECEAPPGDPAANFSLMDNYNLRGGQMTAPYTYTLNELCVAGNHDPDGDTRQESRHGQSCWERLAAHPTRGLVAPAGLPVDAPPPAHAVDFREPCEERRFMHVIDNSGSMSSYNRMEFARQGAVLFNKFVKVNDRLGVVSFSTTASLRYPLTLVTGPTEIAAADAAISALVPTDMTSIGAGLQMALGQFTSLTEYSCSQYMVLLSDGDENTAPSVANVLPSVIEEGISVLTVGVGTGISSGGESLLKSVARQTSGKYFRVQNSEDLVGLFLDLQAEATGGGILAREPGTITQGEMQSIEFQVDSATGQAAFLLSWADEYDVIDLVLHTPGAVTIDSVYAMSHSGIEYLTSSNYVMYIVDDAEPGMWTSEITGTSIVTGTYDLRVSSDASSISFEAFTDKDDYDYPDPIYLSAVPSCNGNVIGAVVTGTVYRPDGTTIDIQLSDEGDPNFGDEIINDGVYSHKITAFSGSGTYTFELVVVNETGVTYGGEEMPDYKHVNLSEPVEPFTRRTTVSVVVTGAPVSCCVVPGDANGDLACNIGDAVFVINYAFKAGPAPGCLDEADANRDCEVNVGDAVYMINFVFKGGPAPECGCVD